MCLCNVGKCSSSGRGVKPSSAWFKDNIYEAEATGNCFRLVTSKTMHPNNIEFCPYDIAGTLDK